MNIYQADAFTEAVFGGNPAAIVPLENWLSDELMQKIAMENNLAETAFIVPYEGAYHIRWFTPTVEVDLCGHATLAAAHIYYEQLGYEGADIRFYSRSGWLGVRHLGGNRYQLDFPADQWTPADDAPAAVFEGLRIPPQQAYKGKFDYLVELGSAQEVIGLKPDFNTLATVPSRGVLVTAKGEKGSDFISRCFFPQSGINEDPVTGSAHCLLTTYWNHKTGKTLFNAVQASDRRGHLTCELVNGRVLMSGSAKTYMKGEIML